MIECKLARVTLLKSKKSKSNILFGSVERKILWECIDNYFVQNKNIIKRDIKNQLIKEEYPRPTIYKAIQIKEQDLSIQDISGSGRSLKLRKKIAKRRVNTVEKTVGISCSKFAPRLIASTQTTNPYLYGVVERY